MTPDYADASLWDDEYYRNRDLRNGEELRLVRKEAFLLSEGEADFIPEYVAPYDPEEATQADWHAWDAWWNDDTLEKPDPVGPTTQVLAANVLRAAADKFVPEEKEPPVESDGTEFPWQDWVDAQWEARQLLRKQLLEEAASIEVGE